MPICHVWPIVELPSVVHDVAFFSSLLMCTHDLLGSQYPYGLLVFLIPKMFKYQGLLFCVLKLYIKFEFIDKIINHIYLSKKRKKEKENHIWLIGNMAWCFEYNKEIENINQIKWY